MRSRKFATATGAAALIGGLGFALPAGASTHHPETFSQAQVKLENGLSTRQTQLAKLTAEVAAATNLSASVAATLNSSLSSETASINGLIAKVPTDTTMAELRADSATMIHDNRVYAVMTPQVRDSIEAANDLNEVASLQSAQTNLGVQLQARKGNKGYAIASRDFRAMSVSLTTAAVDVTPVTTSVLAQTPQGFPGNIHVFVRADGNLMRGEIAIAHASYDRAVIELFVDGYPASS